MMVLVQQACQVRVMPKLFIGNFDFEWSLSARAARTLPSTLRRINQELACVWLAMADADDWIFCDAEIPASFFAQYAEQTGRDIPHIATCLKDVPAGVIPVPWGWSERLRDQLHLSHRPVPRHPAIRIARMVNSRRYSCELEPQFDLGWFGTIKVASLEALPDAIRQIHEWGCRQWVLKTDLGNSARERLRGTDLPTEVQTIRWIDRRLQRDGMLFLEPWVDIVSEASFQWEIPCDGEPEFLGIAELSCDARGQYQGSWITLSTKIDDRWTTAREITRRVAAVCAEAGYFGPLGIDACWYRDPQGELRLRAIQDINARWTMGRLSFGWRGMLRPGETGFWRHFSIQQNPVPPRGSRVIVTSPDTLDGKTVHLRHQLEIPY